MRNARGLSGKQSKFINTLIEGHSTWNEVERKLNVRSSTMQRWMNEPAFILQTQKAGYLLEIRRKIDEASARIRLARGQLNEGRVQSENEPAAMNPPVESHQAEVQEPEHDETPAPPRLTERERILQRHGEDAAQAFDRLVAIRQKLDSENTNALSASDTVQSLEMGEDHGGKDNCDVSAWPVDHEPGDSERLSPVGAVSLSGEIAGDLGGGLGCSV